MSTNAFTKTGNTVVFTAATSAYPDDGKQYKLDIPTATWVLITS